MTNYNWLIPFFHIEGNKLTFEHIESYYQSYQVDFYYFFYYAPNLHKGRIIRAKQ